MTSSTLHTTLSLTEDAGNRPSNHESISKLYVSHDGGQSWYTSWKTDPDTLTTFQTTLSGLYIVDPQHAWAVNQNTGEMYGTTDGGQSWHQLALVGQVAFMSFIDDMSGWMMSQNGFQRTTNGGQSWQYINYYYPH